MAQHRPVNPLAKPGSGGRNGRNRPHETLPTAPQPPHLHQQPRPRQYVFRDPAPHRPIALHRCRHVLVGALRLVLVVLVVVELRQLQQQLVELQQRLTLNPRSPGARSRGRGTGAFQPSAVRLCGMICPWISKVLPPLRALVLPP